MDTPQANQPSPKPPRSRRWRRFWQVLGIVILALTAVLIGVRLALPSIVRWQVNDILNQNPMYKGEIQDVQISLWRGAYSISGITLNKSTGNIPVPLFTAKTVDLSVQWSALFHGSFVGEIIIYDPELNFVDAADEAMGQAGSGPWLTMISELFPLKINSMRIENGSARFHAFHKNPPVDIYASQVNITIENLTNIRDDTQPMVAKVKADGMVMDNAKFEFTMQIDPFSYYPTFSLAFRLLGLDVTKMNDLTQAYGMFDYEDGWFDLVVELEAQEGQLQGYIKPLFRNVRVLSLSNDIKEDNVIEFFWEALVGGVTQILKNQSRDQFGTKIPIEGSLTQPQPRILETLGNVLRNAFIRAYLPKFTPQTRKAAEQPAAATSIQEDTMHFKPGSIVAPGAASDGP